MSYTQYYNHMYSYVYIYIYIYRERERDREREICIYIYIYTCGGSTAARHRSAPKEKCPWYVSMWGPLGDTPPIRNQKLMGPCKAPQGDKH